MFASMMAHESETAIWPLFSWSCRTRSCRRRKSLSLRETVLESSRRHANEKGTPGICQLSKSMNLMLFHPNLSQAFQISLSHEIGSHPRLLFLTSPALLRLRLAIFDFLAGWRAQVPWAWVRGQSKTWMLEGKV